MAKIINVSYFPRGPNTTSLHMYVFTKSRHLCGFKNHEHHMKINLQISMKSLKLMKIMKTIMKIMKIIMKS